MSAPASTVSVRILDKEYQVNCPPDEVDELTASAKHLDQQMRRIREGGSVVGLDRMAVMAALNIAHDLLKMRDAAESTSKRISVLAQRLTEALGDDTPA